jgi:sterol desaturase/sphingolipid hydroxylase (fatty acid hydroxylase superfamily)
MQKKYKIKKEGGKVFPSLWLVWNNIVFSKIFCVFLCFTVSSNASAEGFDISASLIWFKTKLFEHISDQLQSLLSMSLVYLLLATVIALFIDCLVLGYQNSSIKRILHPSLTAKSDILLYILSASGFMRLVAIIFSGGILYIVPKFYEEWFSFDFRIQFSSGIAQFFFFIIVDDFLQYWRHRFGHRISWWWQLHKMHHAAKEFNVITVARSHPLDLAFGTLFVFIPLSLIGLDLQTFILIKLAISIQGKLQHSMLNWRWGWVGKYVFISPIDHRIHHSLHREHWDKNYGHITPLWDRLFGTWYKGDNINALVDITGNYFNKKGFISDLIRSQLDFFKFFFTKKWSFRFGVLKK